MDDSSSISGENARQWIAGGLSFLIGAWSLIFGVIGWIVSAGNWVVVLLTVGGVCLIALGHRLIQSSGCDQADETDRPESKPI